MAAENWRFEVKSVFASDGQTEADNCSWSEEPPAEGSSLTWFWPLGGLLAVFGRTAYAGVTPSLDVRECVAVLDLELSLESR